MDQKLDEIYKELCQEEKKRIVIFGERGVGKTWMAKKLSDRAVRKKDFDFSIWVFLCRVHDTKSLQETVARQISLLGHSDEWEAADDNKDTEKEDENEEQYKKQLKEIHEDENEEQYKKQLKEEQYKKQLKEIHDTLAKKRVLLVLDDEGSKMKEDDIRHILESVITPAVVAKTIVTTRRNISSQDCKETSFEVKTLADKQLSCFLQKRLDTSVPAIKTLAEGFLKKCKSLAITDIIVIEKALNYFGKRDSGVKLLENAFADYDEKFNVMQLLCSGYDLLPSSVLFDFLWEGEHFFRDSRSVHYSELITYWILEGYIGLISSTQKAFEMGHRVVMELIDCHVLKELEAGYVIVNAGEHVSKLRDQRELGFHGTVTIGLATVFDIDGLGFGRITHKDGIVRTLFKDKEGKNLSTLLLDGNHFGVEVLDNFLKFKKVQVLAVFYPTLTSLPNSVFDLTELNVLVLRCCDFLEKVDCAPHFNHLTVLEISGATSLTKLPDDFFLNMPKLRSLNLSELKIESLPSSLFKLAELRWLILRGCSCLKKVGNLKKLENLVHLDLSSASSFENFSDKNFHSNKKLQIINLSKTKIRTLPLLKELGNLRYLLLRDCADLDRLRSIAPLTSLHTLDISGATKFKEFHDLSLEKVGKLKIINLSNTSVELLPSHVSSPRHIFLRCCPKLKQLECMDSLNHLEILDLSGSTQLCSIEEGFFDSSHCLQELMLSETKLTSLPSLSNLSNLRVLSLSCCKSLQKLPELNALTNLEELDATSCTALTVIPDKSFERMSNLQILILSGSNIASLPTLPNPNNLRKLLLKNCANLKFVSNDIILPKLEELNLSGAELSGESKANFIKSMLNLRILDLSETNVEDLPSISNLKSLRFLSLRDCKHLKVVPDLVTLTNLETLDLFGTAVSRLESLSSFKNLRQFHSSTEDFLDLKLNDLLGDSTIAQLPHGISDLPHLELLELSSQKQNQGADTNEAENTGGDLNRQQWMISNWPAEVEADYNKYGIFVSSNQLSELLKDPSLWDTNFKKFHFLVRPLNQLNEKENYKYLYKKELIFRAICLQAWRFVQPAEQLRSLEICGFHNDPVGIDDLLHHAAVLYITDNPFIKVLSDLGAENIKAMKVCWIERCNELKSVMDAKKLNGTAKPEESMEILKGNLEFMFVSNATNVEHIVRGNLPGIFKTLKYLYLDCCPKISTVFCLSQQLDNLEVLEIKFCDELTTLFEGESVQLPKLQKLHLRALPKLKRVGCVAPSLLSLQVVECPILVTILPPSPLLKILHIKCCDNLASVFENKQSESTLPELCELHMWGLPVMKSIGVKVPSLKDCIIRECPKLVEDSSLTNCEGGFRESSTNR